MFSAPSPHPHGMRQALILVQRLGTEAASRAVLQKLKCEDVTLGLSRGSFKSLGSCTPFLVVLTLRNLGLKMKLENRNEPSFAIQSVLRMHVHLRKHPRKHLPVHKNKNRKSAKATCQKKKTYIIHQKICPKNDLVPNIVPTFIWFFQLFPVLPKATEPPGYIL